MSELKWDESGKRLYETGVSKTAVYPIENRSYQTGIAWNGITAINESPSGAEVTSLYADNIKYLNLVSAEDFGLGIEAYMYPDAFKECLGEREPDTGLTIIQQKRSHFGLTYQTRVGNDVEGSDYGYKIHLVYNCMAAPTEKGYSTINDSPEAITYSWDVTTIPIEVSGYKPTSTVVLDSVDFKKAGLANVLANIENLLYGTSSKDATFLLPEKIMEVYEFQRYLQDSDGDALLDSDGNKIQSRVYE